MNAKERVIQFIDLQKISKRKFSLKIGVSHVYFSKENAMGTDVLEKIFINYPELNMDWVVTGRGKMLFDLTNDAILKKTLKIVSDDESSGLISVEYAKQIREIVQDELKKNKPQGGDVVVAGD